jgi:glycosyltransferase involved in cell wall biosynthesis
MNPLLSVIIPSYNSEVFLSETIQSVLNQSYENWECLVIDDGSEDNTADLVKQFILKDRRISYYRQENAGLAASRNYGISLAKGKYIQFIDSDDVLFEDKLNVLVREYERIQNPDIILFTDFEFTLADNPYKTDLSIQKLAKDFSQIGKLNFKKLYAAWDLDFVIPTHAFLFPAFIFKNYAYDLSLKSKEDWDFYLSILASEKISFQAVNYVGCGYRMRSNSMSQDLTSLFKYGLIISKKWGKNKFSSYLKLSQYVLQAYFAKWKGEKIQLAEINSTLNLVNGKRGFFKNALVYQLMPLIIFLKIYSKLK